MLELPAADGIDELVMGFVSRPGGMLRSDPPRVLAIEPTDVTDAWHVRIGPEGAEGRSGRAAADCTVRGPASGLDLLLWNRRGAEGLEVEGDPSVLERWREGVQIRWR